MMVSALRDLLRSIGLSEPNNQIEQTVISQISQ